MNRRKALILLVILVLLVVAGIIVRAYLVDDAFGDSNNLYCTQDVKQCANGSYVSRDPMNNCEFKECR